MLHLPLLIAGDVSSEGEGQLEEPWRTNFEAKQSRTADRYGVGNEVMPIAQQRLYPNEANDTQYCTAPVLCRSETIECDLYYFQDIVGPKASSITT